MSKARLYKRVNWRSYRQFFKVCALQIANNYHLKLSFKPVKVSCKKIIGVAEDSKEIFMVKNSQVY